ncbi:MAG: serine/threonine protein kinase, partial [Deltaproteobacteria bacterium]|nr:serine/threonine protein kinase [Deltaproteobacteria bacterium]
MDPVPGTMVTPNIRLVRQLGAGGMGSVWVAEHLTLKTEVAVKFVSKELAAGSPEVLARFSREAAAAAQIKSPHVVQTLDHGVTEDGTPYIVMELLEGEDVARRIERLGRLGVAEVVEIVDQTCKALDRAHKLGIVHRDIKPDNLLLVAAEGDICVKVLDFGIAKQTKAQSHSVVTSTGAMVGTPEYMSPEQVLSGKEVDFHSDLWSLGVVVYHALTGRVPFTGETLGSLCVAIAGGSFPAASAIRAELPPGIDRWLARALANLPDERFGSAREMAAELKKAVGIAAPSLPEGAPVSVNVSAAPGGGVGASQSLAELSQARTVSHGAQARTLGGAASSPTAASARRRGLGLVAAGVVATTLLAAGAVVVLARGSSRAAAPGAIEASAVASPAGPAGSAGGPAIGTASA